MLRVLTIFAAASFMVVGTGQAFAQQYGQGNLPNHVFSQYATAPGASQTTAGMYPAPHYVPPHVGNSWYTNQALMPQEMMYQHKRNYYNYDYSTAYYGSGASLNKTSVVWQSGGANHYSPLPFTRIGLSKLTYAIQAKKYCLDGNCGNKAIDRAKSNWAAATANCAGGNCQ